MFGYYEITMRFIILSCLLTSCVYPLKHEKCLTGYMTDMQHWVDEYGALTEFVESRSAMDLSLNKDAVRTLRENLIFSRYGTNTSVKYLSMARCELGRVPQIFNYQDPSGQYLFQTVEYVTFFGNPFLDMSSAGIQYDISLNATHAIELRSLNVLRHDQPLWAIGFRNLAFPKLKELDLRACSIDSLDDYIFQGMPELEALYLGENIIHSISGNAFFGLNKLAHLDISLNGVHHIVGPPIPIIFETTTVFEQIPNLQSLDLSHTRIHSKNLLVFKGLGKKLQRLSLCWAFLPKLPEKIFKRTSMKYLDMSGNFGILSKNTTVLKGLEKTLQILYATDVGLSDFDVLKNMLNLEILKLTNNDVSRINTKTLRSLKRLQILDLDRNRYTAWFQPIFLGMHSLKLLTMRENSLNIISKEMITDLKDLSYVGIGGKNHMVCNCHSRDLIEMASQNERRQNNNMIKLLNSSNGELFNFQLALQEFNDIISRRNNLSYICEEESCSITEVDDTGTFLLIDYDPNTYLCLKDSENGHVPFTEVVGCYDPYLDNYMKKDLDVGMNLLMLLIIPGVLLPIMLTIFLLRRKLWYCYVTMRNSATLSLIAKDEVIDENKTYNYDVFVSYCQDDRTWMLDQLLPHVEIDCNVKVCLHERDFQVGLSILENIVSCMDNSKTIMLVISKKFLKSQWCQFEMHLAQHRLLETRREDLILVLLEEIPRRLRPNTLHYLMLTKTYIVWPQTVAEQPVFWRRLKKSLLVQKNKFKENNVILA